MIDLSTNENEIRTIYRNVTEGKFGIIPIKNSLKIKKERSRFFS